MVARVTAIGLFAAVCNLLSQPVSATPALTPSGRCDALAKRMMHHWPEASTRIMSARWIVSGPLEASPPDGGLAVSLDAPEHCEIIAVLQERVGEGGQHYAIRFHLRLPTPWNGRLYFQGGGGSNGVLGDALGTYSTVAAPALLQGFAVLSQDSGHDNNLNNDPARGGVWVFGFDAVARANYGHASLPLVTDAAKAAVKQFYGSPPRHSYFVGCSKGGEEGLALAQRYAAEFDGIAVGAPAMSLPRAALAEAWDTQVLSAVLKAAPSGAVSLGKLPSAFSDADLALVRAAVLAACDADDGLIDGIIGDYKRCTITKVRPELEARRCVTAKTDNCLSTPQLDALSRVLGGAHDSEGEVLYSDWPWDTGIASPGWRIWKLGSPDGDPASLNVMFGGAALATNFTTPPTALAFDPETLLNFMLAVDFDRDPGKIYATDAQFPHSAWDDMSARSTDLSDFQAHGGKLLLTHGISDPVFSVFDTMAWWREVNERSAGKAKQFVRLFPVPGMTHCGGGDATDQYDVLAPLIEWVENGRAPASIRAAANAHAPWPNRTRPLCVYPATAHYKGRGDIEKADSFECRN
jgi:feruloyl esterase